MNLEVKDITKFKCTQYGICGQVAFKNARAIFKNFLESGRAGNNY